MQRMPAVNIHVAAAAGDVKRVAEILSDDASLINLADEDGKTPIQVVLARLADLDSQNPNDRANIEKYLILLHMLFDSPKAIFSAVNKGGKSAAEMLPVVMYGHDFRSYQRLIDIMIERNPKLMVDLFHKAIYADNIDLVQYLLEKNRDLIHMRDARGFSPYTLSVAASAGKVELLFQKVFPDEVTREASLKLDFSSAQTAPAIIKAAITYEDESFRMKFENIIDDLYNHPEFRPTMDLVASSLVEKREPGNKVIRIFIAAADNISGLTPKSSGFGDYDTQENVLRLGGSRDEKILAGTLIHEFTHLAAQLTYGNDTIPYPRRQPSAPPSNQEILYKRAIDDTVNLSTSRLFVSEAMEMKLNALLVSRMEAYRSKEQSRSLPPGALSEPEYLVSVPQAMVLYGNVRESATLSALESRGGPLVSFWRDVFNVEAQAAFMHSPLRKFIDTNVPFRPVDFQPPEILTVNTDMITRFVCERRFDLAYGGELMEGYHEGFPLQNKMTQQIIIGNLLDEAIARYLMPDTMSLAQANALINLPILQSQEYSVAYKTVWNALSDLRNSKYRDVNPFTLDHVSKSDVKKLQSLIPGELREQLSKEIRFWSESAQDRMRVLEKTVDAVLKVYAKGYAFESKPFQKLKFALIESLNVNLPLSAPVDRQFLKEVLPQMLKDHSLLVPSGGKSRGLFGRETLSINSDKTRVDTAVRSLMVAKPVLGEKKARAFTINHA